MMSLKSFTLLKVSTEAIENSKCVLLEINRFRYFLHTLLLLMMLAG